jgi:hypothetical protein
MHNRIDTGFQRISTSGAGQLHRILMLPVSCLQRSLATGSTPGKSPLSVTPELCHAMFSSLNAQVKSKLDSEWQLLTESQEAEFYRA